jgi:hypothetical protein
MKPLASWSFIVPDPSDIRAFRRKLEEGEYLVLEALPNISGYRISIYGDRAALTEYLGHRINEGYYSTIVAVSHVDKTVVWPMVGTIVTLEDLLP